MKKKPIRKIIGSCLLLILLIPLLWIGWMFCQMKWGWGLHTRYYDFLPESATDVHEASFDNFPDSDTILKAKISPEEFTAYIDYLGLGIITNDNWSTRSTDPKWWNPMTNSSTIGAQPSSRTGDFVYAKYEHGYLYLISIGF